MTDLRRHYGAHPAHALVLLLSFVPAAFALRQLLDQRTIDVGKWLVGSAVLHDAVLLPAYVALDAAAVTLWRRRPGRVAWLNFVRIPLAISALLFGMFSPEILRKAASFQPNTGRSTDPYFAHWLVVTALLAAGSAAWYGLRLLVVRGRT